MDHSIRNEQHLTGFKRHWWLAVELILQRSFDDIDNLFSRMRVSRGHHARGNIDARLDHLASSYAKIVSLQIGAFDSGCLGEQYQSASYDQHCYRKDSNCFHIVKVSIDKTSSKFLKVKASLTSSLTWLFGDIGAF